MAQQLLKFFTATVYARGDFAYDAKQGGWQLPAFFQNPSYQAFSDGTPVNLYTISPAITVTTGAGVVTANTIIEVLPTGLQLRPTKFVTDSTFASLYAQGA